METQVLERARYRPSGKVDWRRFVPLALVAAAVAISGAAGLDWLFRVGWYLTFIPILAGLFMGMIVLFVVSRGNCRSPLVGTIFGFCIGVLLYGGSFYFGMLTLLGTHAVTRLDLLPKYISFRLHTDTNRDVGSSQSVAMADPYMNGFRYCLETFFILLFTTAAGYRRSKRSFCEQCGSWKKQDLATFPPGNGKTIAGWLEEGMLYQLGDVPPYIAGGRGRQSTLVALERCQPARPGCAYYLAVKDASNAGGLGRFDSAFGRTRVPRVEINLDEVAALARVFPAAAPPIADLAVANLAVAGLASPPAALPATSGAGGRSGLVEVEALPPGEARRILAPLNIVIANVMSLSILPLFYGGIVGVFVGLHNITGGLGRTRSVFTPGQWLIFTGVSAVAAIFSGFFGLRNSSFIGNRYLRFVARRSIARRGEKWVDPAATDGLPIYFVQVIPRARWALMQWENASDTGFLQIDAARGEFRFEGDVERYRVPFAAITDCSIASYSASAALKYFIVIFQGFTASGPWEAPISIRPTKCFVARNHRQQLAEMLYGQIAPLLPINQTQFANFAGSPADDAAPGLEAAPSMGQVQPLATPEYAHWRPTDLKPRPTWGSKLYFRLALILVAVGFGVWRGAVNVRQRQSRVATFMAAQTREPGPAAARLPLKIRNIYFNQRLTETAPDYAPGGDWTVLQCATADDAGGFTVAIETPNSLGGTMGTGVQLRFANVALLPDDRTLGANLVTKLAASLNQPSPPAESPQPLVATKFSAEFLGDTFGDPRQGLQAGRGAWSALHWLIEWDGLGGEIYFNYNPWTRSAELVGGGPGVDADAIEGVASAIRDGPRPPRTEENDPTFTSKAPTVADLRLIPDSKDASAEFSQSGNFLIYYRSGTPTTIRAIDLRGDGQSMDMAQVDGRVMSVISIDKDDGHILVNEIVNGDALALGQQPEKRIWWIDLIGGRRTEVKGPWGTNGLAAGENCVSPGERYCAIFAVTGTLLDTQRTSSLYLEDLQSGQAVKADRDGLNPRGWEGSGTNLRCIAMSFSQGGSSTFSVDPVTGHCTLIERPRDIDKAVSPDGQLVMRVDPKNALTITSVNGGASRVLHFVLQDRRYAFNGNFQWLSPRYLRFGTARDCFIDVQSMKVGYLPMPAVPNTNEDEDFAGYQFDRNFKHALSFAPDGLMLGRIVLPGESQ